VTPRVSVIVPVRNGELELPNLLEALGRQGLSDRDLEVVVALNGGQDPSEDVARHFDARVVQVPHSSRPRKRNRAVAAASGQFLAFTDVDCVPAGGWLKALISCLTHQALAAGPVRLTTSDHPSPLERLELLWRFKQESAVCEEGWSVTANLAITREAFEAIGGFDESFVNAGEDVDLCLRARAAGFGISWCPEAVVAHPAETRLLRAGRRGALVAHSEYQLHMVHGRHEGAYWRHPGPLVRGDWALRRFGIDPNDLPPDERRGILRVARLEWGSRMFGSLWARLALRGPVAALSARRAQSAAPHWRRAG
jgi:glycosyltransferase involved in cell wall biosynthesis